MALSTPVEQSTANAIRRDALGAGLWLLALTSLLLVGLHPFTYTSLATSFDGLLHLYRLVELDHLIAQGIWFPRWAPDFVFGFGYPIFNFYAPLSYYLSAPLHWLGLSFADSATVFFVACTLGAGAAAFALARAAFTQDVPAVVAALAYAYAPTHIYDNFYRSAWGTVLAYALVPLALWTMLRWYQTARLRYLALLVLSVAAIMLAHNVTALLSMPIIVGAAIVFGGMRSRSVLLALAVGLALSAFFWLPALLEAQYVQTWRLTIPPDFDFHEHFLSVADWIAWPAPAEVGRINPDLVNSLGPLHIALALGGILSIKRWRGAPQRIALFVSVVLVASLFMTLPQSAWLWEHVSILPSLQFPHRFLTPAALCVAVLGGAAIGALPLRWQRPAGISACALLIVAAIPFLYPRALPPANPNPTLADVLTHEHTSGALGTTASGEYFPIWVQFVPRASTFEEAIVNGENPQRFDSHSLPAGGRVIAQAASPLEFTVHVQSPDAFRATFRQLYFPGWQGYVDGQSVPTAPSNGQGFSTFDVPAGDHVLALALTTTAVQDFAQLVSILVLVLCIALVLLYVVLRHGVQPKIAEERVRKRPPLSYLVLGVALLGFKMTIADNLDTPLRRTFDGQRVPHVKYARFEPLGDAITWLGYDLASDSVLPEQSLDLTLYWSAQHPLDTVYSSFAHLVDESADLYAQEDNLHPGGAPTTTWRVREYDVDRHSIAIPAGTPPGDYWLELGMYDPRNGARLLRNSAANGEPPDRFLIGPIHVRKLAQNVSVAELHMQHAQQQHWPNGLTLLGYTLERERLPADDFLRVALFWRNDAESLPALAMRLRLVDSRDQEVAAQRSAPSNDRYATSQWAAGELVRDNRSLWIGRTLPAGEYHLQLQLDGDESWLDLGGISKQ